MVPAGTVAADTRDDCVVGEPAARPEVSRCPPDLRISGSGGAATRVRLATGRCRDAFTRPGAVVPFNVAVAVAVAGPARTARGGW